MGSLPPGSLLIIGALLVPFLTGRWRRGYLLALPLISFIALHHQWLDYDPGADLETLALFGFVNLTPVRIDNLSLLFGALFHLALFIGTIYALHVKDATQNVAALLYAGSAIGAVFAGDLVTLFIYWEVVAVSSTLLIWARRTEASYRAGMRYLLWQIVSGVLLLAGILARTHAGGPEALAFGNIGLPELYSLADVPRAFQTDPGACLIFLAFGIKCAFPGLHTWLTDAYPESTPTGAIFLSAFTTKLAVYVLIRGFAGTPVLIGIGAVMALFPIFYACIENDLRRVLSYSMINQIGFMVIGIGVGTELAVNGAAAHAFADVLFKGLLFMSMGAVLHRTGTIKASDLGGLYKAMPVTTVFCLVGACAISAFPLFSAFATKSLIVEEVGRTGAAVVWCIMIFASAGVLHHAGIKIPYCAFFAHDSGLRPKEAPWNMQVAMGISSVLCVVLGCLPFLLYANLPTPSIMEHYTPYTGGHIVVQLQLLLFAILAFVLITRNGLHPHEVPSTNLDVDWLWRRLGRRAIDAVLVPLSLLARGFQALVLDLIPRALARVTTHDPERGPLFDRLILGSSVLVVVLLLAGYLLIGLNVMPR